MLKYITTKDVTYKGQLFRGRKIVGEEKMLALIYPLIGKAIFTWGWRSKKEQEGMVAKGTSKTMDSNHRRGVAFDVWNWSEMELSMKKLGFINNLKPWDPGHFPLGGEDKARKNYKIIDSLPKNLEEYKPAKVKVIEMKTKPLPEIKEVVTIKTEQAPKIETTPRVDEVVAIPVRVEEPVAKVNIIEQQVEEIRQAEEAQKTESAPVENNILQIVFNLVGNLIIKIINIWTKR